LHQKYNKAVRDKIPEIILKNGKSCKFVTLPDNKFLIEMEKKLSEEIEEYLESKTGNELADIIEVVYRIAELRGISNTDMEKIRQEKIIERGAFSKNYFLIGTG
jgi:predicted house-cleaning noncanonical NTP pyrophosphatase (MazG superfamily)